MKVYIVVRYIDIAGYVIEDVFKNKKDAEDLYKNLRESMSDKDKVNIDMEICEVKDTPR